LIVKTNSFNKITDVVMWSHFGTYLLQKNSELKKWITYIRILQVTTVTTKEKQKLRRKKQCC